MHVPALRLRLVKRGHSAEPNRVVGQEIRRLDPETILVRVMNESHHHHTQRFGAHCRNKQSSNHGTCANGIGHPVGAGAWRRPDPAGGGNRARPAGTRVYRRRGARAPGAGGVIGVSHHPHNWHTGIYLGESNPWNFPMRQLRFHD